jgi:hypothetical protein
MSQNDIRFQKGLSLPGFPMFFLTQQKNGISAAHFLLSAAARSVSVREIFGLSD